MIDEWVLVSREEGVCVGTCVLLWQIALIMIDWRLALLWRIWIVYRRYKKKVGYLAGFCSWVFRSFLQTKSP